MEDGGRRTEDGGGRTGRRMEDGRRRKGFQDGGRGAGRTEAGGRRTSGGSVCGEAQLSDRYAQHGDELAGFMQQPEGFVRLAFVEFARES